MDVDKLMKQLLPRRMYNERALPVFYLSSSTFNVASMNTNRLTLSSHLSFKKITVVLANFQHISLSFT